MNKPNRPQCCSRDMQGNGYNRLGVKRWRCPICMSCKTEGGRKRGRQKNTSQRCPNCASYDTNRTGGDGELQVFCYLCNETTFLKSVVNARRKRRLN